MKHDKHNKEKLILMGDFLFFIKINTPKDKSKMLVTNGGIAYRLNLYTSTPFTEIITFTIPINYWF